MKLALQSALFVVAQSNEDYVTVGLWYGNCGGKKRKGSCNNP
jgi:hypothetical protein